MPVSVGVEKVERTMTRTLCRGLGVSEVVAAALVEEQIDDLRKSHGGTTMYIPVDRNKTDVCDMARQMYTGTNAQEVCDRLGIGRTTLYRYLGRKV